MSSYLRPASLDEALAALARTRYLVLAGGTDVFPAHVERPLQDAVLDLSAIAALRGIVVDAGSVRIGATTTWSDIVRAELPPALHGLQVAAREVGGVQIQNAGTVAGNLCNASPAADGVPALLALDAQIELASRAGQRRVPLEQFITGVRKTACAADELVTAIRLPARSPRARSDFRKLGARRYLVISVAMVAVVLDIDGQGSIDYAGVAVGACSPVARRLPALEAKLHGRRRDEQLCDLVTPDDLRPLAPIDDVRATAAYRNDAALELVRRALRGCCE